MGDCLVSLGGAVAGDGAGELAGTAEASFERLSDGEGPKLRTRMPTTTKMATVIEIKRVRGLIDAGRGAIESLANQSSD